MKSQEDRLRAMEFAKRLVQRRQELGWNQAELTRRLRPLLTNGAKLDRTSMSRYEAGQNLPRPEVLQALSKLLEVPVDKLLPAHVQHRQVGPNIISQGEGMTRVTLDAIVSEEVAMQIWQLLRPKTPVEKKD